MSAQSILVDRQEAEQGKVISIIGYIGILFLVPLLAGKDNRFAQYHANQALVLFLLGVAGGVLSIIPIIGWLAAIVISIFSFVCMIMGIVNAARLEAKPLPLIGGITLLKSY